MRWEGTALNGREAAGWTTRDNNQQVLVEHVHEKDHIMWIPCKRCGLVVGKGLGGLQVFENIFKA
jgi:hypothetical protein